MAERTEPSLEPGRARIRLRIGIALMFLGIMLPLTGAMTAVLYRQNSRLALDSAETAMASAGRDVSASVRVLIGQMAQVVQTSVAFGMAGRESLRNVETLRPLVEQMEHNPDLYAMFFAFNKDGAFYEVLRVPVDGHPYGPYKRKPPPSARYVLRIIDSIEGRRMDSWIYIANWGKTVKVERAPEAVYDPRPRVWYKAASGVDGVTSSGVHILSSLGQPGITLASRMATADGELIGVFGADITTQSLARFLADNTIGADGATFLMDPEGHLIGYAHPEKTLVQQGDVFDIVKAEAADDPVVADTVRLRRDKGDRFRTVLGRAGQTYLVSFLPFTENLNERWTIGVAANELMFTGALRHASVIIVVIGSLFLILAALAVLWASRLLTNPIRLLIEETGRIRQLKLEGGIEVTSRISEIHALADAVGAMKVGLQSFGTYVPRDLVRGIVDSGIPNGIGGQRRHLTLLFTDLANFTPVSEGMEPEQIMEQLSRYFRTISLIVESSGGIIDKFMGDAVMALWNAPGAVDDHAARACRAVLDIHAKADAITRALSGPGKPPLFTRFGLHSGQAVVGNVGSDDRKQYTALGATVNLASRIEGINKLFGTNCLVSAAVEEAVRGRFALRPLGPVVAVGTGAPMGLFELLGEAGDSAAAARIAAWEDAFAVWQARAWDAATQDFAGFLRDYPDDGPGRVFLARAEAYRDAPPPENWDGAIRADSK